MQNHITIQFFKTPFGELILGEYNGKLCLADWRYRKMRDTIDKRIQKKLNAVYTVNNSDVIEETKKQLTDYFAGNLKNFTIPLLLVGTDFQIKIWKELQKIPFGETKTYLQLAKKIKQEKAVRAVANANGANAISILIPCHRIIGTNGKLTGYAGGLNSKKRLLELEGILLNNQLKLFDSNL